MNENTREPLSLYISLLKDPTGRVQKTSETAGTQAGHGRDTGGNRRDGIKKPRGARRPSREGPCCRSRDGDCRRLASTPAG